MPFNDFTTTQDKIMNHPYIKYASMLIPLMLFFSVSLHAQEKQHSHDSHKEDVAHMHHQLENDQAPYKAKEAQALKELNEMTIREDVRIEAIHAKIDELMAAQNMIMRLRYEHLVEMRKTLTDEQKIKYDQNVLKRTEVK
jgi:hypothetical protein